jgi:electron transport complex protein RnfD
MSENQQYLVSSSPHVRAEDTIPKIMYTVFIALIPAALFAVYNFGYKALFIIVLCTISSVFFEWAFEKISNRACTALDGSAAVTGILLALNLPASIPWWVAVIGSMVAIVIGKQVYGGLGSNIFNPALIARVFLLISWPVEMTSYPPVTPLFSEAAVDAATTATPLTAVKMKILMHTPITDAVAGFNIKELFIGMHGGSMGEVSIIALLIGAAILFYKKYITWHIPITYILTVTIFAVIFYAVDPARHAPPLYHLLSGGLFLGAFFMATDMVTSPITHTGMILFGFGCGFLTILIRAFGAYPEGVSFAILLMNLTTPIIDMYVKPKKFGEVPANA